jgi:orotate phosphoribosyltransferase
MIVSDPYVLLTLAEVIHSLVVKFSADVLCGEESAGCALVSSTVCYSATTKQPIIGCYIRKKRKQYGFKSILSVPLRKDSKIILVDDVIRTGKSLLNARLVLEAMGHKVVAAFVVVDRTTEVGLNCGLSNLPLFSLVSEGDIN